MYVRQHKSMLVFIYLFFYKLAYASIVFPPDSLLVALYLQVIMCADTSTLYFVNADAC